MAGIWTAFARLSVLSCVGRTEVELFERPRRSSKDLFKGSRIPSMRLPFLFCFTECCFLVHPARVHHEYLCRIWIGCPMVKIVLPD